MKTTVICNNPNCGNFPLASKCIVFLGKTYCNNACWVEGIKAYVNKRLRELNGNVQLLLKELNEA